MLNLVPTVFDDVTFVVPSVPIEFPHKDIKSFGTYCGPGDGVGDKLVPDVIPIFRVKLSPACWIHDLCFQLGDPTWSDFRLANSGMLTNAVACVYAQTNTYFTRRLCTRIVQGYVYSVDCELGMFTYWKLKLRQGYTDEVWRAVSGNDRLTVALRLFSERELSQYSIA